MILESLLELVETLKGASTSTATNFGTARRLPAMRLIDPLLRELGWDTEDPKVVIPEYHRAKRQPC